MKSKHLKLGRGIGKLDKEDLKNIEGVYNTLIKDKGIQEQMERIKEHEWVRVVEGEG
jgi:hypothetical protein